MRNPILAAGLLAALASGTAVSAQQNCEQHSNNRVLGTVAGAGIGAVLGNVIAGRGDKTLGTVIGGVGGAVAGNQIAKPNTDCAHAYGYFDRNNDWHANDVRAGTATGYFDRNSQWIDGAPRGSYDASNRWNVADTGNPRPGMASGYYDNGRWVAGPASGRYDDYGRWIAGAPNGRTGPDGRWIANPEPGYYDSAGRWNRGETVGSYDTRGTWVASRGDNRGNGYANGYANAERRDLTAREDRIEQRIRSAFRDGSMNYVEHNRAAAELATIKRDHRRMSDRRGRIASNSEQMLQARLDRLNDRIRYERQDGRNG
ncbi:MAG: hypothetical protein CFE37_04650 [Alphaproteobacteria bacterium PA4]|nr:MAG: hypothetical protein CFE37_04650 [Alphaproteobacteria bacterium PA4]